MGGEAGAACYDTPCCPIPYVHACCVTPNEDSKCQGESHPPCCDMQGEPVGIEVTVRNYGQLSWSATGRGIYTQATQGDTTHDGQPCNTCDAWCMDDELPPGMGSSYEFEYAFTAQFSGGVTFRVTLDPDDPVIYDPQPFGSSTATFSGTSTYSVGQPQDENLGTSTYDERVVGKPIGGSGHWCLGTKGFSQEEGSHIAPQWLFTGNNRHCIDQPPFGTCVMWMGGYVGVGLDEQASENNNYMECCTWVCPNDDCTDVCVGERECETLGGATCYKPGAVLGFDQDDAHPHGDVCGICDVMFVAETSDDCGISNILGATYGHPALCWESGLSAPYMFRKRVVDFYASLTEHEKAAIHCGEGLQKSFSWTSELPNHCDSQGCETRFDQEGTFSLNVGSVGKDVSISYVY